MTAIQFQSLIGFESTPFLQFGNLSKGFDPYYRWLKRVTTAKEVDWKWWGIFKAINLTYHDVEPNYPFDL